MTYISDKLLPSVFRYMDFEYITFDELIGLLNATQTTTVFNNYLWLTLFDYIKDNKIKTKSVYKNYVFKGCYRNGVMLTSDSYGEYLNGLIELVDEKNGSVDYDDCYIIIRHKESNRYMKISGEYTSYNGNEYSSEWCEVEPYDVTVTEYRYIG